MSSNKLITSVDELIELSEKRKAVVFNGTKPKAAAFFIGMPLRTIINYIKNKMLYAYEKQ